MTAQLTTRFGKLTLKFNKAAYNKVYFKKKKECAICGSVVVRHMMRRHLKTAKCRLASLQLFTESH